MEEATREKVGPQERQVMRDYWIRVATKPPPEGVVVETKIDDARGCRNVQRLKLRDRLWRLDDGSTYVYYRPTHWRHI